MEAIRDASSVLRREHDEIIIVLSISRENLIKTNRNFAVKAKAAKATFSFKAEINLSKSKFIIASSHYFAWQPFRFSKAS